MSHSNPFDSFRLEVQPGGYKDFGLAPDDPYPLKGVTYPVKYGDIPEYIGEDGDDLDVFMGEGDRCGWFTVARPDVPSEHKVYVNLTEEEQEAVLKEFEPVILEHKQLGSVEELIVAIEPFKKSVDKTQG